MGALVLQRRVDETVVIGGNIRVTVADVRDGNVKLAIEAPAHLGVWRQEVAEQIVREGGDPAIGRGPGKAWQGGNETRC